MVVEEKTCRQCWGNEDEGPLVQPLGSRHLSTLNATSNLGALLAAKGDLAAAEPLLHEALEVRREILGNRHSDTLISINDLGTLLQAKGDLAAAERAAA